MILDMAATANLIIWGATAWVCIIVFCALAAIALIVWGIVWGVRTLARRYRARTTPIDYETCA